ncbi:MAG: hypothetical protein Q8N44_15585 [Rubrivivax sp.]|nr:hypothetical protein [Rubrivivax sp.]MDP3085096.1 hypothetical protein [Rubrivivax sp.]
MPSFLKALQPLQRAAKAFFSNDVALRRVDGRLRLRLEDRSAVTAAAPAVQGATAADRQQQSLQLMIEQLGAALDEAPETRRTLRHLVFVEHALQRKGLRALHKMPLDVLQRGLAQFEGLVMNWSPVGLATLRSKMAVAAIARESQPGGADAGESVFAPAFIEAEVETPQGQAARAIEDAREAAFGDSTFERLALQFGVAVRETTDAPPLLEVQGELGSPSTRALTRDGVSGAKSGNDVALQFHELKA